MNAGFTAMILTSTLLILCGGCTIATNPEELVVKIEYVNGAPQSAQPPLQQANVKDSADPDTRQITMNGYGKAFYEADVCDLTFSVVTIADSDLSASFDRHRDKTVAISAFMANYGGPETICAARATVLRRQERSSGNTRVEEYQYTTEFTARFNITEDVGIVQKELVARGVNQISRMQLRSSKYNDLLRQARDLGVSDAKEKVAYLGEVMGWEITEIANVVLQGESTHLPGGHNQQNFGHRGQPAGSSESAFETFIDAAVQVTFSLQRIK